MATNIDIIIVGGGMVGASLALALKNTSLNIAVIEAHPSDSAEKPGYNDRGIALSYGSQRIFTAMGIWSMLSAHCTAINDIHISDRGHFGIIRLSAKQENVPALGQVITARALGKVLNQALPKQSSVQLFCPNRVTALSQQTEKVTITLDDNQKLSAKLIVAADGAQSTVRHLLGLGASVHDYQQTAITAIINTQHPHYGCAFERFTNSGPIAFLPLANNNESSLVWTVKTGDEVDILTLPDEIFLAKLQDHFGYRLGKFMQVKQRQSYPLKLMQAEQVFKRRVVLVGNAAHSLHPIAGQSFNLSLRDVVALTDALGKAPIDCGNPHLLHRYQKQQQQDQACVIKGTQILVNLFSNSNPLLGSIRGAGLALVNILPPVKHWISKNSMGLGSRQITLDKSLPL